MRKQKSKDLDATYKVAVVIMVFTVSIIGILGCLINGNYEGLAIVVSAIIYGGFKYLGTFNAKV